MRTSQEHVKLILIDDTLDLLSIKMQIIVFFNLNSKHKDHLDIYVAGDCLQTLFTERNSKSANVSLANVTLDAAHAIYVY
jgi:hypothetical protein